MCKRVGSVPSSLLIGSEIELSSLLSVFAILSTSTDYLRFFLVVVRHASSKLLLHHLIQEAHRKVKAFTIDLALCQRNAKHEPSRAVTELLMLLFQKLVLKCPLLHLQVSAEQVIVHDLFDVVVLLEVEGQMELCEGKQYARSCLFVFKCPVRKLAE